MVISHIILKHFNVICGNIISEITVTLLNMISCERFAFLSSQLYWFWNVYYVII